MNTVTVTDLETGEATTSRVLDITSPATIADEIGSIRAEIASLQLQQKTLEDLAELTGEDAVAGDLFRVTISRGVVTKSTNWKGIATTLAKKAGVEISRQLIKAHTKETVGKRARFRCYAMNKDSAAS